MSLSCFAKLRQRAWVAIILAVALLVVFGFLSARNGSEPQVGGRRLSAWLALHANARSAQRDAEVAESEVAGRAIGSNAIPVLLEWLGYDRPSWMISLLHSVYRNVPKPLRSMVPGTKEIQPEAAIEGFRILGPAATNAIPKLVQIVCHLGTQNQRERAIEALCCIGKDGLVELVGLLGDPRTHDSEWITEQLIVEFEHNADLTLALPLLL